MARFFSWWYLIGWKQVAESFGPRLKEVSDNFSVNQLSRTMFAPWRRIITYPGASFSDRIKAFGDNLFSRTVGFIVRLLVILTALVVAIIVSIITLIELILWPLLPPAVIGLLIAGVVV